MISSNKLSHKIICNKLKLSRSCPLFKYLHDGACLRLFPFLSHIQKCIKSNTITGIFISSPRKRALSTGAKQKTLRNLFWHESFNLKFQSRRKRDSAEMLNETFRANKRIKLRWGAFFSFSIKLLVMWWHLHIYFTLVHLFYFSSFASRLWLSSRKSKIFSWHNFTM